LFGRLELFNDVFTADDIIKYCTLDSTDAKEDVICEIVRNSIMIFPDQPFIFNLDARRNLFIPLLKLTKDNLRSVLKRFVCKEMERFSQREGFEEFREEHKKNVDELLTGSALNGSKISGYELKLSLNVPVNEDQFGIHFANGRYDLRGKEFAPRLDPFTCGLFVTKWINYDFTTDETTE
jgi:hypothetical protein